MFCVPTSIDNQSERYVFLFGQKMITSFREIDGFSSKKGGAERKTTKAQMKMLQAKEIKNNDSDYVESSKVREIIRKHQVDAMQLNNLILKKDIEIKRLRKVAAESKSQLELQRHEQVRFQKMRGIFEAQQKEYERKVQELMEKTENVPQARSPRDRYETCLRELDLLKMSLDDQEESIKRQRDLYKDICEEVRALVDTNSMSAEELRKSLRVLFSGLEKERVLEKRHFDSEQQNY